MDRGKAVLIALLAMYGLVAGAAEPQRNDKGWMAHNMSGSCEMARGGLNLDPSDTTQSLIVQANRDPRDKHGFGPMRVTFALRDAKQVVELDSGVVSFSILDDAVDSAARLTVTTLTDMGLSMVADKKAEAALSLFATERLVRVQKKNGSVAVFRFPVKGYATSKAMFDACEQVLRKSAN